MRFTIHGDTKVAVDYIINGIKVSKPCWLPHSSCLIHCRLIDIGGEYYPVKPDITPEEVMEFLQELDNYNTI